MNMTSKIFLSLILLFSKSLFASDGISDVIIHFEEAPFKDAQIFCEKDNQITPRDSNFEMVEYALMSSGQGHRYALITIKNASTGQRTMSNEHIIAILANCDRIHPINFLQKFKGSETITKEVNFGISRFPIIKVITEK